MLLRSGSSLVVSICLCIVTMESIWSLALGALDLGVHVYWLHSPSLYKAFLCLFYAAFVLSFYAPIKISVVGVSSSASPKNVGWPL